MVRVPGQDPKIPVHSSDYAKMARGQRIGAMSPMSFSQRVRLEKNRRAIARYSASGIGSTSHHRPDYVQQPSTPGPDNVASQPQRSIPKVQNIQRAYKEPPTRPYNPYR